MKRGSNAQGGQKGAIRIISGQWRGRKLPVLNAEGLRPTTDRNKETLFNWLMHDVRNANCLDMFAGSGNLGFEALSRYANHVTFIEMERQAARQIGENLKRLTVEESLATLINGDALSQLPQIPTEVDIVFVDPPFNQGLVPKAILAISQRLRLSQDALVFIECESQNSDYDTPDNWQLLKEKGTSQVSIRLFQIHLE